MLSLLSRLFEALGKFFFPVVAKSPNQPAPPLPVPPPVPPIPPPVPPPIPPPIAPTGHGPQSPWWDGTYAITQGYGCTHLPFELHNPHHPECDFWHDGVDFALPCGTPIYAGGEYQIASVDDPSEVTDFGVAALGMIQLLPDGDRTGYGVWLLHMNDYVVSEGQRVHRGDLLGHSGTRGNSTGCHLHFGAYPYGGHYFDSINPQPWIVETV